MANSLWIKVRDKIEGIFTGTEQSALMIATNAAHYVEQNGGQVLRDAASAAVQAALTVAGGGGAKAAFASAQIIAVLIKEGIPVVKSAVNLAIEMALADLKTAGIINESVANPT